MSFVRGGGKTSGSRRKLFSLYQLGKEGEYRVHFDSPKSQRGIRSKSRIAIAFGVWPADMGDDASRAFVGMNCRSIMSE